MVRNVNICILALLAVLVFSSDAGACLEEPRSVLRLRVWLLRRQLRLLWRHHY